MSGTPILVFLFSLVIAIPACTEDINSELILVAIYGHTGTMRSLLNKGADVDARDRNGMTVLMLAAREGRQNSVKILLDKGADVNAKGVGEQEGWTALMYAIREGHVKIVKFLLNKDADVNAKDKDGRTALSLAKTFRHTEIVKLLNQAGVRQ